MSYQIQYCIPYEGWEIEHFDTWEEVEAWVEAYKGSGYKPFNGYTIYKVECVGGDLE